MPYATNDDARAYYAGANADILKVEVVARQAARLVQRYAPVPALPPADYAPAARDAELMVGQYLWATGGFRTSTSKGVDVLRKSESYADLAAVKRTVAETMGPYAKTGKIVVRTAQRG